VIRGAIRGLGEVLITAGLVLLLFVAYQLVWTNYEAHRRTDHVADDIRDQWSRPPTKAETRAASGRELRPSDFGKGFAFLHIPRLGKNWSVPVVEGVELPDLARGVGHYPETARPGQVGNFAVAGHRATNGEPFAYLDKVRPGDMVVAETRRHWFTYVVDRTKIVSPTSTWVLDPVPGKPGVEPTQRLITLTTCNPRWASYERLIVFGHLVQDRTKQEGPPEALLRARGRA
jgi:sortase A